MQQTFPYKHSGSAPLKVAIGVGDEPNPRLKIIAATSSPFSLDSAIYGWWGRDADKTAMDKSVGSGTEQGDYEFMCPASGTSPWFDVPSDVSFVILHTLVANRGMLLLETGVRRDP